MRGLKLLTVKIARSVRCSKIFDELSELDWKVWPKGVQGSTAPLAGLGAKFSHHNRYCISDK